MQGALDEARTQNRDHPEREQRADQVLSYGTQPSGSHPEQRPQVLTPATADPPENNPVQRPQLVLLMGSKGKYGEGEAGFTQS